MPLYDCDCPNCGQIKDVWAKIAETEPFCPKCGAKTERLISPTRIICDLEPYFDENLAAQGPRQEGQWVTSRQDRRQKMKELGLAENG